MGILPACGTTVGPSTMAAGNGSGPSTSGPSTDRATAPAVVVSREVMVVDVLASVPE